MLTVPGAPRLQIEDDKFCTTYFYFDTLELQGGDNAIAIIVSIYLCWESTASSKMASYTQ